MECIACVDMGCMFNNYYVAGIHKYEYLYKSPSDKIDSIVNSFQLVT